MKRITKPKAIQKNQMHNLWKNKHIWWLNYTIQHADGTVSRIRMSTKCKDEESARNFRDAMFSNPEHK